MMQEIYKTVELRTARKQHTCGWCHRTIHPGQAYLQIGRGRFCCTPPDDETPAHVVPTCDGEAGCDKPITHLDTAGFGYCTDHGLWRRQYEPCRKLTPAELNRLARGQQIARY